MLTKSVVGELSRSCLRSAALLGIKKEAESLSKRYRLAFDGAGYQPHSKELMNRQWRQP
ncbi:MULTISPECIES: hypothetical protein [Xanthomonas]|uniref:hypothetical protein n=1 Tax=Xanthomonas TaxID=338 RepID=UPI001E2F6891|nr:hypothetical protein [Xanthomonas cannabis]MCC8444646.1 hypothetical protein [Xanthomonas cannabis]